MNAIPPTPSFLPFFTTSVIFANLRLLDKLASKIRSGVAGAEECLPALVAFHYKLIDDFGLFGCHSYLREDYNEFLRGEKFEFRCDEAIVTELKELGFQTSEAKTKEDLPARQSIGYPFASVSPYFGRVRTNRPERKTGRFCTYSARSSW